MMRSLRTRLVLGISTATSLILVAAALIFYALLRAVLIGQFDASLLTEARALASACEFDQQQFKLDLEPGQFPEFQQHKHPAFFQILDVNGQIVSTSIPAGKSAFLLPLATPNAAIQPLTMPDGHAGRAALLKCVPRAESGAHPPPALAQLTVIVGRDTHELSSVLEEIGWGFFWVWISAIAVLVLTTTLVIRKGLRPVTRLAADISGIGTANLSDRLDVTVLPSELSPIVARLNELLSRLQNAFERERAFTSDAAHELRTPLAGLEAALDVCASRRREPEAYATVVQQCLGVVRGMHSMVDGLLVLARADAEQVPLMMSNVSIDQLLRDVWQPLQAKADDRGLRIGWQTEPKLNIDTDREKLHHVLSNLLDNATRYANPGGHIRIGSTQDQGTIVLHIANSGSHVAAEDAANVFDRFWRGDPARSSNGERSDSVNCGLGLAVCRKLVDAMLGTIAVSSSMGGEFVVEVRLPGVETAEPGHATTSSEAVR